MGYRRYYGRRRKSKGSALVSTIASIIFLFVVKNSKNMNPGEIFGKFFAIFIGVLLVALIIKLIIKTVKNNKGIYKGYYEVKHDVSSWAENNYKYKGRLLVKNEKIFYNLLKEVLQKEYGDRYEINCQVRMMDLFEMKRKDEWIINLSLDYLIVDKLNDFKPVMAIELDGESHNNPLQQQLDATKEELISITDIYLVRIRNEDNLDKNIIYKLIIPRLAPIKGTSIFSHIFGGLFNKKEDTIEIPDIANYGKTQYENNNETFSESSYIPGGYTIKQEKSKYSNIKSGLGIGVGLAFIFIGFIQLSSNIKNTYENGKMIQINNQSQINNPSQIKEETTQQPSIKTETKSDLVVKEENNPCQNFIDKDKNKKQTSDKYSCTSNIFYSIFLNSCIKNEICSYLNNEKRYYIHNLSAGEYIFSCHEDSNGNRKNYKINTPEIRDIVWPGEKLCNSLYAEIYRDLHQENKSI